MLKRERILKKNGSQNVQVFLNSLSLKSRRFDIVFDSKLDGCSQIQLIFFWKRKINYSIGALTKFLRVILICVRFLRHRFFIISYRDQSVAIYFFFVLDQDLGSGRRSDVIINGCMNYFKYFCRQNMQHCEQMLTEVDIMTAVDAEYNSIEYWSILNEIVSDSKRNPEVTKDYIMRRVRDYPILTTLLVTNETLPLIMDDVITMFAGECDVGESLIRKFLRFVLSNNPEANNMIAENYINQLSNKVFKKQGTLDENRSCFESLTLLNSLLFESSPKAKENIWKQRRKLEDLDINTEIVPLILKTSTEKMQKLNRDLFVNFLERNFKT